MSRLPAKPWFHLPPSVVEIILPRGTSTEDALRAGGRAVMAVKGLVAKPIQVRVEAREMHTSLQLVGVETAPFVADARDLFDKINDAIGWV